MIIDDLLRMKDEINKKPSSLRTREEEIIVILLERLEQEITVVKRNKLEESRKSFESLTKITSGPGSKCPCCGS